MHLCGAALSPYFERCALVVEHKNADEATIKVGGMPFAMKSDEHMALNPLGKIPFLLLGDGTSLVESQIIAEYLDATLEGPSCLPSDPEGQARVKLVCRLIDHYLGPVFEITWMNRGHPEDARKKAVLEDLPKAWDYLEHFIADTGYAYGDGVTLADYALIPWLFHLKGSLTELGPWEPEGRPKLQAWLDGVGASTLAQRSSKRSYKSFQMLFGNK